MSVAMEEHEYAVCYAPEEAIGLHALDATERSLRATRARVAPPAFYGIAMRNREALRTSPYGEWIELITPAGRVDVIPDHAVHEGKLVLEGFVSIAQGSGGPG